MRSKLLIDVALMVLVCSLAGCGVEDKKEQRKESVASESADKKREECKEEFFNGMSGDVLTKNCIYTTKGDAEDEENEDEFCIVQKNRRGEEQNRFGVKSDKEYGSSLVAGSDKRLILSGMRTNKDFTAKRVYWQVPIRQTKDGEILLWEERKEVVSGEPLDCDKPDDVYVVEPYMLFHDGKNIVRINLETGERRQLAWEEDLSEATLSYFGQDADAVYMTNYPLAAEGQADAGHDRGILYRIDIETWEAEEVYAGAEEYSLCKLWKADGTHMYLNYTTKEDSDVWQLSFVECYDRKRKQSIGRCTRQDIERLLDKEHIYGDEKKGRGFYIEGCFTYAERIYMIFSMMYNRNRETDGTLLYDERQVLLSCPLEDMSKVSYEREVSEWWYENTYAPKGGETDEEAGARALHRGDFLGGFENEFYFTYMDKEKKEWHVVRYDLKTKKQEEVGEKEPEYLAIESAGGLQE